MYPSGFDLFGVHFATWNAVFLCAIAIGYVVFRTSAPSSPFAHPLLRYLFLVYLSAISAQMFANAFDATGRLVPPAGITAASWYLNPIQGPKTLYGAIVLMPLSVALVATGSGLTVRQALDLYTPALFSVLAGARVGCFLAGCCYGMPSTRFGIEFPPESPAYAAQVLSGAMRQGDPGSPAVPTQAIEAVFLAALSFIAWIVQRRGGTHGLFVPSVVAYSIFRFSIEFLRADADRGIYGPLATSQWIALAVLSAAVLYGARGVVHRVGPSQEAYR